MKKYVFGTSPLGPSRRVKAAIRKATGDIGGAAGDAQERLERMLCSKFGVAQDNLLLASSLQELLYLIPRALKPENVLVIGPAVNAYREAALSAGARTELLCGTEEMQFEPDMQRLGAMAKGYDMVFLANPNRLIGTVVAEDRLPELLETILQRGRTLVIDESFMEFVREPGSIRRAVLDSRIIVLRTTSCYYGMPGLELAYAVSATDKIRALQTEQRGPLNLLSIKAAHAAFKDKAYSRLMTTFITDEKRLLQRAARTMRNVRVYGSDTHVLLMRFSDHADDFVRAAERQGLAVASCEDIQCLGREYMSVSIMKHDHMLKLIRMLKMALSEEGEGTSRSG